MIEIGKHNTLEIVRDTSVGLFLSDGETDVLLPNKYVPKKFVVGDEINVFIYLDHEERLVATTLKPYIELNQFAHLKVNYINKFGAFLNWGLEKDLFVPFKEQAQPMEIDKRYLVYMYLDEKTNRLAASSKTRKFLDKEPINYEINEPVSVLISHITDAGINVIINQQHKGLAYKNEIFEDIKPGQTKTAFIKQIRPDGKIDVVFQKQGFEAIDEKTALVLEKLKANNGFLGLHDKSHPEEIKTVLKMSKKNFKKAIGVLYKEKQIILEPNGISLVE